MTTNLDVYAHLVDAVRDTFTENNKGTKIKSNDTFKDLGLDSLDMLSIICDIEAEFNIVIPDGVIHADNTLKEASETIFCLILNSK